MKANHNGHGGGQVPGATQLSPAANHEVSDVELRGIIVFLIGLTMMTVVVYLLMMLMFTLLNTRETAKEVKANSPLALKEKERLPPEPRLQSAPGFAQQLGKEVGVKEAETATERGKPLERTWELDKLRKKWEDDLKAGPRDQSGNPIGMSIDQAKQQVLSGNGLPARATTSLAAAGDAEGYAIDMPTAASSGRMTEKRRQ